MVPPLQEAMATAASDVTHDAVTAGVATKVSRNKSSDTLEVSFSHVQLYVDKLEDLKVYQDLERSLNEYAELSLKKEENEISQQCRNREIWNSVSNSEFKATEGTAFNPQNRDLVKQLLVGFGFRVTGYRFPSEANNANAKSLLVTSKDESGVQIVLTARESNDGEIRSSDDYNYFDTENLRRFYQIHSNRQGIAALGFRVNNVDQVLEKYQQLHPNLIHSYHNYEKDGVKVLEVYAYYVPEDDVKTNLREKQADIGTILRFVESSTPNSKPFSCILPGFEKVDPVFDDMSQPAYFDHWVSNVFSRTEFLRTLEDTLGFTPKVDFNAGVVAAGEAQIESTVTGNNSTFTTLDKNAALRDQSQVYLPINNALSSVGHVHGFLQEIGQGIQHVASRVENLVEFVQRCNEITEVTGEGFTFLKIPRSYYGVLASDHLESAAGLGTELSDFIIKICERQNIVSKDGAVDLNLTKEEISNILDSEMKIDSLQRTEYWEKRVAIIEGILSSRYKNLCSLLRHHVCEDTYLGIVRNQVLVDVQGEDILYQIFTCNILQREPGDEAPFLEFIQRVCSECESKDGCPVKITAGCGGFGIRNFLTLFLSIEVSKAMLEASEAKSRGDEIGRDFAQRRVDCFTRQLNDSNPILTEISDAMTEEGFCKLQMEIAQAKDEADSASSWKEKMLAASERKKVGNSKLMECSARYEKLMRNIREAAA